MAIGVLLLIPLQIISQGFLPEDDALRYAAKAVSGKDLAEIMVVRPELAPMLDHNPGWHLILGLVHKLTHWETDSLVVFSVCLLFLAAALSGLPWQPRPEAWLAALAILAAASPLLVTRLAIGRPFLLSMAVVVLLLRLWGKPEEFRPSQWLWAGTIGLFALAIWIHGTWYLFVLVPGAFCLARRWGAGWRLGVCWLIGTGLAALLTGRPWSYVSGAVVLLNSVVATPPLQRQQVAELMAYEGDYHVLVVIALFLLWRLFNGQGCAACLRQPAFVLMGVAWVLSLKAMRFWLDWGYPAALVWLAGELQAHFERGLKPDTPARLAWTGGLAATLFLLFVSDVKGRWTNNLTTEYLTPDSPGAAGWLPEDGGIIYSPDMAVFYNTFFKNPRARWKYILGFMPTAMPQEDLEIYFKITRTGAADAWRLWVKRMRPQDRMMMRGDYPGRPPIPELEWRQVAGTWIGRLPRKEASK